MVMEHVLHDGRHYVSGRPIGRLSAEAFLHGGCWQVGRTKQKESVQYGDGQAYRVNKLHTKALLGAVGFW